MWESERNRFPVWTDRLPLDQHRPLARLPVDGRGYEMVAIDLDLHLHNAIRLLMREEGKSADQAFDAAIRLLFTILAQDCDDPIELEIHCMALLYLREDFLTSYRKPQPDLSDLTPLIRQKNEEAATRQRERRKRRQLGGRP